MMSGLWSVSCLAESAFAFKLLIVRHFNLPWVAGTFVATAPASYLTVMPDLHVVIVDDFLLRGVPEPSPYALMGILVLAAAMQRRRPA